MFKKIGKISLTLLCAASMLFLQSCTDLSSTKEELAPVMTISGNEVPFELYRYVALNYRDQYEAGLTEAEAASLWLGEEGAARLKDLEENVFSTLKNLYATVTLAHAYGFDKNDPILSDSLDLRMDAIYETYENDMRLYKEELAEHHMNDGVYRFLMWNEELTDALFHAMLNKGEIISEEEQLRALIDSDEFVRIKQILIAADNGKSQEENLAKAEKIYAELTAGADFETLLGQYGEDLYMFNNPDGYYIIRGSRYEAFEDAAFQLEIGEFSEIVETEAGFSILMRYEKEDAYLEAHFDELCQEYFDAAYNLRMEAHAATLTIETLPLYEEYTIFNMEKQS